jgi:hypothetical protein
LQEVFQRAVALPKEETGRGHTLRAARVVWAVSEVEHGTVGPALRRLGLDRLGLQEAARRAIASAPAG